MLKFDGELMRIYKASKKFILSDESYCIACESDGEISDRAESVNKGDEVWVILDLNTGDSKTLFVYIPKFGYATDVHRDLLCEQ